MGILVETCYVFYEVLDKTCGFSYYLKKNSYGFSCGFSCTYF
jgi:hypothetical protein